MEIAKISAEPRTLTGKNNNGRLRRAGKIPAIAYGKALTPISLQLDPKDLLTVLRGPHGRNSVVEVNVDGQEPITAMVKEYTYHPVTRELLHADFLKIDLSDPVEVKVPFETSGRAAGVQAGGKLRVVRRDLPVKCVPQKIPAKIVHDISDLGLAEQVKVSELKLDEGVEVTLRPGLTLAMIEAPKRAAKSEEDEEESA